MPGTRPRRRPAVPACLVALACVALAASLAAPLPCAHAAPRGIILEDFEDGQVVLESWEDQDLEPDAWDVSTSEAYDGTRSLRLYGNTWKAEPIAPYAITGETVFQVAALIHTKGEMQGFGVSDGTNALLYTFAGTQLPTTDPWLAVYQGAFPEEQWNLYLLPIGRDWRDRYGYDPELTALVFVNDRDQGNGVSYFDAIADVTGDLPQAPQAQIIRGREKTERLDQTLYRVGIQFGSQVLDPDTPPESLAYSWDFGDGGTSVDPAPYHEFLVEAHYTYSVILYVRDPDGLWGRDSTQVRVDPGTTDEPVTLNFVGDVMLARGYDVPGGLIDQHGPEWMFIPTKPYLGDAAELTLCNLECPFTDEGVKHPTKSVTFRARPENVAGISFAGFDAVSLGNNHIIDYGERGMEETLERLDGEGLPWTGAGLDEYMSMQPVFLNTRGVSLAMVGQCNRTGREYNYQPFLDAGYNKPGFAWLIEANLDRTLPYARSLADLTLAQLHSGIEYSTGPGTIAGSGWPLDGLADPPGFAPGTGLPPSTAFPSGTGFAPGSEPPAGAGSAGVAVYRPAPARIDPNDPRFAPRGEPAYDGMGPKVVEDGEPAASDGSFPGGDFLFPTRPSLTDRQLRWHAVDIGADLVINHHTHVLQGFEVYNGVLIAHSLGNFVFDQSYAETMPSLILYTSFHKDGFRDFTFRPAFVDDWIPQVVSGRLGREILDRQAEYSRELGCVVTVDPEQMLGTIQFHPEEVEWTAEPFAQTAPLVERDGLWTTPPIERTGLGTLARVLPAGSGPVEVRLGRELVWHGDMEEEGATFWDLNSSYESYDEEVAHQGERSLRLRRSTGTSAVATTLQGYPALPGARDFSLTGWIRTQDVIDATLTATVYTGRGSGQIGAFDAGPPLVGTHDWTYLWNDWSAPDTPWFFQVRARIAAPQGGEETAWFDEVRLIAWDSWQSVDQPLAVPYPSNYRYLQFRTPVAGDSISAAWEDVHGRWIPSGLDDATWRDGESGDGGGSGTGLLLARPRPTPFRSAVNIEYRLTRRGPVRIEIFDLSGRTVATLADGERDAGVHTETWRAEGAPNGLYFVRCRTRNEVRTEKLVLLR